MKILPEYLINYIPYIEEALEELRLSVRDHAYELYNTLDLDELSSDVIRRKLELYDIKLENMTSYWLPNGRFYRIYPSIKHHRTRYNTIQSIVKSGGQFEDLWSTDFGYKQEYNYSKIQLLRHYQTQSDLDGYFYISGDTVRNPDGTIKNSTLLALSTDALVAQALPAGYTYLYLPWPRPHYPSDVDYHYNLYALQFDRLHYANDCDNIIYYDEDHPASDDYYGIHTYKQSPYWYDYRYRGTDSIPYSEPWPILDSGYCINEYGDRIARFVENPNKVFHLYLSDSSGNFVNEITDTDAIASVYRSTVSYEYDEACERRSSDSFLTKCLFHEILNSSEPNREQGFIPVEEDGTVRSIDTEYTYEDVKPDYVCGQYRWDYLASHYSLRLAENMHHIKTYRPFWDVPSPLFACVQSTELYNIRGYSVTLVDPGSGKVNVIKAVRALLGIGLKDAKDLVDSAPSYLKDISTLEELESVRNTFDSLGATLSIETIYHENGFSCNSLYSWFLLKEGNNIIHDPDIVDIDTFTSYDRPTASRLDQILIGETSMFPTGLGSVPNGSLYHDGSPIHYNPELNYNIVYLSEYNIPRYEDTNVLPYIKGDPATGEFTCVANGESRAFHHVGYKVSETHRMWFSPDRKAITLDGNLGMRNRVLYNDVGRSDIYSFSSNTISMLYTIKGVYDSNGNKIALPDNAVTISLEVVNDEYILFYDCSLPGIQAAYVMFTVKASPGAVKESQSTDINAGLFVSPVITTTIICDV